MTTEIIIKPEDQALLNAIKNTGKSWFEVGLPDHELYPKFARKLVVTGFNTPDIDGTEERIYVNVRQYLVLKEGGTVHKKVKMPDWQIHEGNVEEVLGANGMLYGTLVTRNNEGIIISEEEVPLKAQSVQYVRFLVKNKQAHLVEILERFISLYMQIFETQINDI